MKSKVVMELVQKGKQSVRVFQAARGFHDIKGRERSKRGLEVGAAGSHNALMIGPSK
ncbi:MAG: ATP-binding protein [Syntrophobacteraceae bacterium]